MPDPEIRARILVVEDEAIVARDIQLQLAELGYEHAGHTTTGEQALVLTEALRPDLVLMDVQLAGAMDGITAAELIRTQFGIPVVYLTAFAADDTVARAKVTQPFGYILKPFAERELRTVLEMALYQHQVETRLRVSEERARTLIEWTPQAMIVHRNGKILYVNPAALTMFGVASAEDVIGTSIFDRIHPESRAFILTRIRDLALRGINTPLDVLKGLKLDGSTIVVESRSAMITYDGAPAIHSSMNDITARVHAEAALRRSEAHNRAITQSAHDAIVTSDRTGMIVGWNSGAETVFGYTESEILGQSLIRLMPERFAGANRVELERVMSGGASHLLGQTSELTGVRKDGREIPMDLSLAVWQTTEGRFATSIIRDISERRLAEATLRLESAALEAAGNAIVITDRVGAIEWANAAFTSYTGYSLAEAVGRKPGELLKSGKHDAAFYHGLWETILAGSTWHGEVINRRKDGTLYTEEMTITPLRAKDDTITHFIAVKQDITEQKRLEEQYRQAQKMESVGRLAGGVAHDFNNMLGVILGNLELVLPQVETTLPLHGFLLEIKEAAQRSATLTQQLLTFARKQAVAPQAIDLNANVAGMLTMLQRMIGEGITITWRPAEALWPITIDSAQIGQIMTNLCINARDAIGAVGAITVTTTNRVIDADEAARANAAPGEYVRLSVRDTGCGMNEEILSHLFEPFFTTKGVGVGTGLGLATVYGAVLQNRGFISVSSTPGAGSVFEIHLPRSLDDVVPAPNGLTMVPPERGSETILVVEDEPAILKLAARALKASGYTVLTAATPDEALRVATRHDGEIHLLLTDVVMPGMNGQDLAKAMMVLRPKIRRMFMSGYPADIMAEGSALPEGVSFLQKPFLVADLSAQVRETLAAR